jgi:hypothetical protein
MDLPTGVDGRLTKRFDESLPILLILDDILPAIPRFGT